MRSGSAHLEICPASMPACIELLASLIMFHPGAIVPYVPFELASKYLLFPVGIAIFLLVVLMQKVRMSMSDEAAAS